VVEHDGLGLVLGEQPDLTVVLRYLSVARRRQMQVGVFSLANWPDVQAGKLQLQESMTGSAANGMTAVELPLAGCRQAPGSMIACCRPA
jgi:hypothetical protein